MTATIQTAMNDWLQTVWESRSESTYTTYRRASKRFIESLLWDGIKSSYSVTRLKPSHVGKFISHLRDQSPSTEKVYLTAVKKFYKFIVAEELATMNMEKVEYIIDSRARRPGKRFIEFPKDEATEFLDKISTIPLTPDKRTRLRELRDIAMILTLADTGLRIHEVLNLTRADYERETMFVIGKGNKEGKVFQTDRTKRAIGQYLRARSKLDGATGIPLVTLPLFARHDKAVGKRIEKMSTVAGRNIFIKRVKQIMGKQCGITPHTMRHMFVTRILDTTGNLKLAQELARHSSIQVTEKYAHLTEHELEKGHQQVFGK